MAITFVGAASNPAGGGGDPSVILTGLSLQQGDLVVVAYAIGDNDSVDFNMSMVTAGYTEVADIHAPTDTQDCDLGVYWKVMGVTPDTTAVANGLGGSDASVAAIAAAFRGVDQTTPMDATPTTASSANSNRPNPPSLNHNNPAGVWTLAIGAFGHTSGTGVTATAPTNYTNTITAESANDTSDVTVAMAYRDTPADPEDPGIFTPSIADNTAHTWCACTIALRPASSTTFSQTVAA